MRLTYISWAAYCSRSDNTARELGGRSHMVYWGWLGSRPATVWLKYLGQFAETLGILAWERPEVVFVMSPPVFAGVAVWVYCTLARARFVIDMHTAALLHPRWRKLLRLQYALCGRAATTIVTNDHLAGLVRQNGSSVTIVPDVPVEFPVDEPFPRSSSFSVAVVCSFNSDEPIEHILRAAVQLDDVQFYMTGNPKDLKPEVAALMPPNVSLTGFLSDSAYGSLLTNVDAVMTLTTRDHTMLRGAYEAVYQGTPVIVSDWPLLRVAFDRGAIHVDNTPGQIVSAVRTMHAQHPHYKAGVAALRERKHAEWHVRKAAVLDEIEAARTKHQKTAREEASFK